MSQVGAPELLILLAIGLLLVLWPWWRIFSKAGYPGWYAFSQLVPVLNVVVLFYLASSKWPVRVDVSSREPDGRIA